ncbi:MULTISPECIES: hypothetical protein [Halolamina]|uniref:Uncharacterized protein n=1 Tax=Halolamina pelagica TaxID=699431 RepID=A0A1I5QW30_9EURY|nr:MULTISPECIES: hypothetical protein [Halolamina]NHX35574.1 hypothetical protein [Halolamina sp. R1-12]SFP50504.1 hypothetical protein SAMN05216277_104120 [Halolamina pelagica]
MGTSSTPPVVRDSPPRDRGPDLSPVGTDLVICDGEVMTYGEYRRERDASTGERERVAKIER